MSTQTMAAEQPSRKQNGQVRQACKVAILGFGTVGSSVAKILCDSMPNVQITHVLNRNVARKRADWMPANVQWTENFDEVLASNADILIELMGGLDPAEHYVRSALAAGKSVATANKKLIGKCGPELGELARQHGCNLLFGAAVAGGVPVIDGLQHGLGGDQLHRLFGILNGTCNFILSRMSEGMPFPQALRKAQELGFAEADPTDDVEGYDARSKLVILARSGLRAEIDPAEIVCKSIVPISPVDFEYAKDLNCTIRQISRLEIVSKKLFASVQPMLVPLASPLANVQGSENIVIVSGKYGGDTVFSGHGAGGNPTAVAVVSDVLAITEGRAGDFGIHHERYVVNGDLVAPQYIRFVVQDRPGIIASIAGALAESGVNLDAVIQRPGHPKSRLTFVITVEPCPASMLANALAQIGTFDFLLEPPLNLQIMEHA